MLGDTLSFLFNGFIISVIINLGFGYGTTFGRKVQVNLNDPVKYADSLIGASLKKDYYQAALILFNNGKDRAAEKLFKETLNIPRHSYESNIYLGKIELRKPDEKIIPLKHLKKLFNKDHFSKGIGYFEKSEKMDPMNPSSYYYQAKAYLTKRDTFYLNKGLKKIDKVIELDSAYKETFLLKGELLYQMGKHYKSLMVLTDYLAKDTCKYKGRLYYYFALNYHKLNKKDKMTRYYLKALDVMKDSLLINKISGGFYPLLDENEKKEFSSFENSRQLARMSGFWKSHDSDYATEENELLYEHIKRLDSVFYYYRNDGAPQGFDDRGMIYVRFGKPARVFRSLESNGVVNPNESWVYVIDSMEFYFDFVKIGNKYLSVSSLKDAIISFSRDFSYLKELYKEREHIGKSYESVSNRLRTMNPNDRSSEAMFNVNDINENYVNEKKRKMERYRRDITQISHNDEYFPFFYKSYHFMKEDDNYSVRFHVAIPTEYLTVIPVSEGFGQIKVNVFFIINNLTDQTVEKINKKRVLFYKNKSDVGYFTVFGEELTLKQGMHRIIINVKDRVSGKSGFYETERVIGSPEKQLIMSDLFLSIPRVDSPQKMEDLHPYPFSVIKKENKNYLYFEVYHLRELAGFHKHSISYELISIKPEENGLKKMFRFLLSPFQNNSNMSVEESIAYYGPGTREKVFLQYDLGKLPKGECVLKVKVVDQLKMDSVIRQIDFSLK